MPAWVEESDDQRIVEAAAVLPPYGGVTGWAGLAWMRGRWFADTLRDVMLATAGTFVRRQPGFSICEEKLDPADLIVVDGLRVTSAVRSVCFEMRYARSLQQAVAILFRDDRCFEYRRMRDQRGLHIEWRDPKP